jgi:parvulin-like peptidyl-prolyl isomerase
MSHFFFTRLMPLLMVVVTTVMTVPGLLGPAIGWAASDPVLVQGQGFQITKKELESKVLNLPLRARELLATDEGKDHLLRELVRIEVFSTEAKSEGMEKDAAFQKKLAQVTNALLAEEYTMRKILSQPIPEEDAKRYYQEHTAEFKVPERIKAPFIFISVPPKKSQKIWKEKESRANDLQKRAKRGEDFTRLMETASDAAERESDYFARGRLVPTIEEEVFRLKVGEVSPVFKTESGFLIYKLEDRLSETTPPYDEVICRVKDTVRQNRNKKEFEETEKKLYHKYGVVFSEAASDSSKTTGVENNPGGEPLTGKITSINLSGSQGRMLGTFLIEEVGAIKDSLGKAAVNINQQTAIFKDTAQKRDPAKVSDLKPGQWVEVTPTGPVLQSCAVQVEAATIVILSSSP